MKYNIEWIKDLVRQTAREILLPGFATVQRSYKPDGSVVSEADLEMQRRLQKRLAEEYPDIGLLGEEMTEAEQARVISAEAPYWCLDPLDGSNNFTSGIPYFSVSLALVYQGKVRLGIVYDPVRDEMFSASENGGCHLNDELLQLHDSGLSLKQSIAIIDFKRLSLELARRLVTEVPYSSQRSFGSVALDWCWLAKGRGHLYLHGRSNIWDYVAGHYIFSRAGGYSCTLEGGLIFKDVLQTRSVVAATDHNLFSYWTKWLGIEWVSASRVSSS